MEYYPFTLGSQLIDGGFDWSSARSVPMERFLAEYTLHDSYWVGLFTRPAYESVAVFRWDTFWSKERVEFPGSLVETWPFLVVRFQKVYQVHASYPKGASQYTETIQYAESEVVSEQKRVQMLEWLTLDGHEPEESIELVLDGDLHHTRFFPVYGGRIDLWYGGPTQFLCLSSAGGRLEIPDL